MQSLQPLCTFELITTVEVVHINRSIQRMTSVITEATLKPLRKSSLQPPTRRFHHLFAVW